MRCLLVPFVLLVWAGAVGAVTPFPAYFDFELVREVKASEGYFDFSMDSAFISANIESPVRFSFDLADANPLDFVVKPVVSKGAVTIWDKDKSKWILGTDLWTSMPRLTKDMKIALTIGSLSDLELWFQIKNLKSSDIYETPKHTVHNRAEFEEYVKKLNNGLVPQVIANSEGPEFGVTPSYNVASFGLQRFGYAHILQGASLFSLSAFLSYHKDKIAEKAKTLFGNSNVLDDTMFQ